MRFAVHHQQKLIDETRSTAIAANNARKQLLLAFADDPGLQRLDVDPHRGQRRTQFVSGIGNKHFFPFGAFPHPGQKVINRVDRLAKLSVSGDGF